MAFATEKKKKRGRVENKFHVTPFRLKKKKGRKRALLEGLGMALCEEWSHSEKLMNTRNATPINKQQERLRKPTKEGKGKN